MRKPPLDPPVNDQAPEGDVLTRYDQEHLVTYLASSMRMQSAPSGPK
jgi:hypothetical protein